MERPKIDTVEVTTPTGYTVILKKKLTYGEKQQITKEIMGDAEVGQNIEDFKMKFSQASDSAAITILHYIQSWDVTNDGKEVPVTLKNIKDVLFEEDVNLLSKQITEFQPDAKNETGS